MSKFMQWRVKRFIRKFVGFILNPFLKVNYRLAEHLWATRPNDRTHSYAFRAQDAWWNWNHEACKRYVNRRFAPSDPNAVPWFE